MPILVTCPGCSARLNAPDSAAGKRVRCPKPDCGTLIPVPAALEPEYEEVEEPAPRPRSKPVRAAVDDDEDRPRRKARRDEDDEGDRPRSKRRRDDEDDDRPRKRRKKKQGMGAGAVVALALGSLLVLGGIGYGVYALVSKKSDSAGGGGAGGRGKAAVPAGWVEYTAANDKFKAHFPQPPETRTVPGIVPGVQSVGLHMLDMKRGERRIVGVVAITFAPTATAADRDRAMANFRDSLSKKSDTRVSEPRAVTWGGQSAQEITLEDTGRGGAKTGGRGAGVIRYMTTDTMAYVGIVGTDNAGRLTPEEENGFFDSFELLR